jgi:ecdysone 20-monooxygenase
MGAKTILGFFPALNGVTDDFIDLIRSRRTGCSVIGFEELAYRMGLESEFQDKRSLSPL